MALRRGFSLAEVLLSLSSLAVMLVMAVGVLHFALHTGRRGEHSLRAAGLAQEKLAEPLAAGRGRFAEPWQDYRFTVTRQTLTEPGLVGWEVLVEGPSGARARLFEHRRERAREIVLSFHDGDRWRLARAFEEGGERTLLAGSGGNDTQPTIAADGQSVVFVSDQGGLGLWTMPLDGSRPPVRLSGVPERASAPAFAPHGGRLAFTACDPEGRPQIFTVAQLGASSEQLTHGDLAPGSPAWSPDGSQLAVVLENSTIALLPAGGGAPHILVEEEGWNAAPAFSPDGRWLAFMSNRDGNPELYRLELGSGRVERLTQDPAYDTHPRWSTDGRRLAFQSDRGGVCRIWTMNADGSEARRLGLREDEATPPGTTREGEPAPIF